MPSRSRKAQPPRDRIPGAKDWKLHRCRDGSILIRVRSKQGDTDSVPDAVFTFRVGDPQYDFWADQWAKEAGRDATSRKQSLPKVR